MGSIDDGNAEPEWDGSKESETESCLESEGGEGEGGNEEKEEGPTRRSALPHLAVAESRTRPDDSTIPVLPMPSTGASGSSSPTKIAMSVERSFRQTHSQLVSSQASQFLEKVMTGFDQGGGDSLEKAEVRYEKLEARYEKLEEKKEKLEVQNERLRVENNELRDEIRQLALLEAQVGRQPGNSDEEGGYSGLFSQTLQRL
ncbi:hypothetical protein FN846DRAFT_915010 [Sphaerosporella brunnea]|uniref:Uncharacterized protein n=1 Tax=Sphaerosporella brunnea TaxID=1250544 RepID=A0A5J5EC89_9PEZI|nr:hypothetical protein FN846DRAFT_915010 [Sphaerosporella brunnea]